MLKVLQEVEKLLPQLLQNAKNWKSVLIDYHPPVVRRLWMQWNDYRIYLHRIDSCNKGEALFHPHPWSSAVKIVNGEYEMGVGYGTGTTEPPIAATLVLTTGSKYEMVNPNGWHYVRPINGQSLSIMVASKPTGRLAPKSDKPLKGLSQSDFESIIEEMRKHYPINND